MLDAVTIRYAEALFGLATKHGVLDEVHSDVERLRAEFDNENVRTFFLDARLSIEVRRTKLEPALQGMHELTRKFVNLCFDKRREEVLAHLGEAFHVRMLEARNAAEGVIESARPLDESAVRSIERAIGERLGKTIRLSAEIDPSLVGGARVIVESRMIDVSLAGRLEALRKRLLAAPLGAASAASD
ncbi:MAG: ATP synthase F1 subunit delta [Planctomycetota bacterium]